MSGEEEQKTKPGWRERMGMSNWTSSAVNTDEESDQASMSQVEPESVEEEKESRWSRVKSWTKTKVKEMRTEKKDAPEGGVIRLQDFYDLQNALLMVRQENIEEVEKTASVKRELQDIKAKYRDLLKSGGVLPASTAPTAGRLSFDHDMEEGSPAELASEQMSQAPEAAPRGRQPEECAEVAGQEASHLREQLEAADRRQKEMWQQVTESNEAARKAKEEVKRLGSELSAVQGELACLKASQMQEQDKDEADKQQLKILEETVAMMTDQLAERDAELENARHKVEDEVNAREAAELESKTLEEALGEEMAELETQCEEAELQAEEATKKAAALELEIAEHKAQNKRALKKCEQSLKDLKKQLQKEHETREGLEKALERQMSPSIASPVDSPKKAPKLGEFTKEAEELLRSYTPKQMAQLLLDRHKEKMQSEEFKAQLEMSQIKINFVEENNALLMKDLDRVETALKENQQLKDANSAFQLKIEELRDEISVLNDDRETKATLLKKYITSETSRPRTNSQEGTPKSARGRADSGKRRK